MTDPVMEAARRAISFPLNDATDRSTPPAGVAIAVRGQTASRAVAVGASGRGASDLSLGTVHDIASVTKIIATTTCLMRLASLGLIGLDNVVSRFIPEFGQQQKSAVTVRDLLQHRAGLWEWQPLYFSSTERAEALAHAASLPPRYPRGWARKYSDLGFMLLGEIVSNITTMPLDQAVAELVTGPLGMVDTSFGPPRRSDVAASSYGDRAEQVMVETGSPYPILTPVRASHRWRQDIVLGSVNDGNAWYAMGGVSGHAGLFSTVPDLLNYCAAMAQYEDREELFHPEIAREFFDAGPDTDQGLGFRRYPFEIAGEHVALVGHTGFTGCAVGFVPGRGIGIVLASNRLLTPGKPVSTDSLWKLAQTAARRELEEN